MSDTIKNIEVINTRAAELSCVVTGVLGNNILCRCTKDSRFVTWAVYFGAVRGANGLERIAHFEHGHYDMSYDEGHKDLVARYFRIG